MSEHLPFSAYRSRAYSRLRFWLGYMPALLAIAALGGCDMRGGGRFHEESTRLGPRVVPLGQPVPKGGGRYKVGEPYRVNGRIYTPREYDHYDQVGLASWYGELFHGRRTANGEIYDMEALTAAHPTLPIPSYARVTNLYNGRSLVVRVNDRGPYAHGRIIDLSWATAALLQIERPGVAKVRVQYLGEAPLNGDDSYERRVLASQPWAGPRVAFARSPAKAMRNRGGGDGPTQYSQNSRETAPEAAPAPAPAPRMAAASAKPDEDAPRPAPPGRSRRAEPRPAHAAIHPAAMLPQSADSGGASRSQPKPAPRLRAEPDEPSYIPFRTATLDDAPPEQLSQRAAAPALPPAATPVRATAAPPAGRPAASRRTRGSAPAAPYLGAKAAAPGYYVEAGIFPERPLAEKLAAILRDIAPTAVEDVTHEGRPAHRIRLGPFQENAEANAAAERIRAAGLTQARLAGGT